MRKKSLRSGKVLRLGAWNIKSWNNKDQEVLAELTEKNIDICSISEVKKKGKGMHIVNNYIFIYSGKPKNERAKAGVGMLLQMKFQPYMEDIDYVSEAILKVRLKIDKEYLHIISVYAPDSSKSREERRKFYEELQNQIDTIPDNQKTILMGDFNARVGDDPLQGVKQRFNENVSNDNGDLLVDFCAQNNLRINNTFFNHDLKYKYTFRNAQGHQSTIDYIITNRRFTPSEILEVRTLNSANIGSDHALVLCKIRARYQLKLKTDTGYIEKLNVESLEDESTKNLYATRLQYKINRTLITDIDNPDEAWTKLKNNILEAAEEAVGKRKVKLYPSHNNKTPWYTTEVKEITEKKKKAFLRYKTTRTEEDRRLYVEERNITNEKIKRLKEIYWEKYTKDMERDMYGSQKKIWRMLRNRKAEVNETVKINPINNRKWEEYFESLYKEEEEEEHNSQHSATLNWNESKVEITTDDIQRAMKNLKNRKAPGRDNIRNELLKYGGKHLIEEITKLLNNIIRRGKVPLEWKTSITIPIFKKGNKNNPGNYRGITLLNTTQKLLTKVILEKIQTQLTINEEQQGFRPNRSTNDAIFVVRQLVEKAIEFKTPAFMCFVDLQKAFDRVKLRDVITILQEKDIPKQLISIIEDLNTETKTKIQTGKGLSGDVKSSTGIRQGDSLSPILFNLIMNKLINSVKNMDGYKMGDNNLTILCYADDAVLIADSEDNLQRLLYQFTNTAKGYNMIISTEKTKSLVVSKEPIRCKLEVNNKIIEQVMSFMYLGVEITSERNSYREVKQQVRKAARVSGFLRDVTWKNKYLTTESKVKIYKTMVRPIMTYAAETRADTSRIKQQMRTTEMSTLRAIVGKTRRDRVRNEVIREECGIGDVVRFVRQRRREWNEHVQRADEGRLIKIARDQRPAGRRDPGRPLKRWKESWISISTETP